MQQLKEGFRALHGLFSGCTSVVSSILRKRRPSKTAQVLLPTTLQVDLKQYLPVATYDHEVRARICSCKGTMSSTMTCLNLQTIAQRLS
eukprot:1421538-Amphidinium_carterae.1